MFERPSRYVWMAYGYAHCVTCRADSKMDRMDDLLGFGLAALGLAAYGKYLQVTGEREQAVAALRERARQTQDALDDMEIDLIANPGKYSAKQLRSARRKADRAQEALLLAEAGVSRF